MPKKQNASRAWKYFFECVLFWPGISFYSVKKIFSESGLRCNPFPGKKLYTAASAPPEKHGAPSTEHSQENLIDCILEFFPKYCFVFRNSSQIKRYLSSTIDTVCIMHYNGFGSISLAVAGNTDYHKQNKPSFGEKSLCRHQPTKKEWFYEAAKMAVSEPQSGADSGRSLGL